MILLLSTKSQQPIKKPFAGIAATAVVTTIVVLALVVYAYSLDDTSIDNDTEMPKPLLSSSITNTTDVIMPTKVSRPGCEEIDACYIPSRITVGMGEQITWINEDSAFHSVTSGAYGSPNGLFDSEHMDPYQMYTQKFDESGTYDYHCTLHPWMKGQVIVNDS